MKYRALDVFLGQGKDRRFVGQLFQYGEGGTAMTRLVPDKAFWTSGDMPVLSQFAVINTEDERIKFFMEAAQQPFFNGEGETLPPFFQNMLPEGPLRQHLEVIGELSKGDHFGLLSMCGTDLPGAVYVQPATYTQESIARVVTQNNDALEMTVTPMPVPEATSLSGVQPKLSLVRSGGRYVQRTKDENGVHIIAKLPTVQFPLLPQVEELSMRMASEAGVTVCEVTLAPVSEIHADQPFVLGQETHFLAVRRFDRAGAQHIQRQRPAAQVHGVRLHVLVAPVEVVVPPPVLQRPVVITQLAHQGQVVKTGVRIHANIGARLGAIGKVLHFGDAVRR